MKKILLWVLLLAFCLPPPAAARSPTASVWSPTASVRSPTASVRSPTASVRSPTVSARQPASAFVHGVKGHAQSYSLSCESRSAADWAAFWGVRVRERAFLNRLPRSDNPDAGFVGDPNDPWGRIPPYSYGVHAEPVAQLLRAYGLQAKARHDLSWNDLRAEIAAGRPVIVWVIGQMWKGAPLRYTAVDGHTTIVATFEHTVILVGYEPAAVHVIDAYSGQPQTYPLRSFLDSWDTLGNMAVTGQAALPVPNPGKPVTSTFLPLVSGPAGVVETPAEKKARRTGPIESYVVRPGDTLTGVAYRFGLDWLALAQMNGISAPYLIYTGQVLRLR